MAIEFEHANNKQSWTEVVELGRRYVGPYHAEYQLRTLQVKTATPVPVGLKLNFKAYGLRWQGFTEEGEQGPVFGARLLAAQPSSTPPVVFRVAKSQPRLSEDVLAVLHRIRDLKLCMGTKRIECLELGLAQRNNSRCSAGPGDQHTVTAKIDESPIQTQQGTGKCTIRHSACHLLFASGYGCCPKCMDAKYLRCDLSHEAHDPFQHLERADASVAIRMVRQLQAELSNAKAREKRLQVKWEKMKAQERSLARGYAHAMQLREAVHE
ncbi:hypothetical protein WJX72_007269 [[Myrmecia] bisecta]|uniref:Uncharacterized protein n=1 Tax=[Myrmecia] bisecta TaxID=41462 RepID=A0AAW1Q9L5_9CHLO